MRVVNYADTRFSNFAIEYLRRNEKVCKLFLRVHMGPRSNLLSQTLVENLAELAFEGEETRRKIIIYLLEH